MGFTSLPQANSKTAEFARLFDLFDRVATRRARALTGDNSEVISTDDIANVPAEFAPVLKNLSTILSLRARRAQAASRTKPRHNTPIDACSATPRVDVMGPPVQVEENENPSFPLGQRYPFTFKLMLHELYDMDEWAEKVESAVEASKSQFKPLAERVQNVDQGSSTGSATSIKQEREKRGRGVRPVLGASAKFKPPSATRQAHSGTAGLSRGATASTKGGGGKRSSVCPVLGASAKFKPPSTSRHPHPAATPAKREASRVLKKRCIGRRKSTNGTMATGMWVYDAVISAIEVNGARLAVEITLSAPRGHGLGGVVESRMRHRSLTAMEDVHDRDIAKRKIKITVPLPQEERAEVIPQAVTETGMGSIVRKRRSMASSFVSESCKRVAVKRPLCV